MPGGQSSGKVGRFSALNIERVTALRGQGWSWAVIAQELDYKAPNLRQTYLRRTDPKFKKHDQKRSRDGARKRRLRVQAIIATAKDRPCSDCGIRLPFECMELDHVRGTKEFPLGHLHSGDHGYLSIDQIVAEIAKCEVRCPNCHRLRHYRERLAAMPSRQMKMAV